MTTIASSLGVGKTEFPVISSHPYSYAILISIIFLATMINHKSETMLLRASNGCLIVFGLAVGIGTVNYFAVNNNPGEIGIGFAFSLVLMFYSGWLYVCLVIWTMLKKQLRPNLFALKNWHLAEMFTFRVFAVMSPPSLWEAIGAIEADAVVQAEQEHIERRFSELEDRLATLSNENATYVQPPDN